MHTFAAMAKFRKPHNFEGVAPKGLLVRVQLAALTFMFSSKGKLHYHKEWLMLYVEGDICRYYRTLVNMYSPSFKLNPPKFDAHVTVVAGKYTTPVYPEFWNKYEGEIIQFEYDPYVVVDREYFWLQVQCKRIEDIRVELGLPRTTVHPWHLTIGNTVGL